MAAFEASGLTSQAYLAKIPSADTDTAAVLQDALADHDQKTGSAKCVGPGL